MALWTKEKKKPQTGSVAVMERPRPLPVTTPAPGTLDAYRKVLESIRFQPAAILDYEIELFLKEQQIPIYDNEAVVKYMMKLAMKARREFYWRPLRAEDAARCMWKWDGQNLMTSLDWDAQMFRHDYYDPKKKGCDTPYDKPIPIHILGDVKTIEDKFGERVAFFVTDYSDPKPDPFILVTGAATGVKRNIFGAWDEPGFGVV